MPPFFCREDDVKKVEEFMKPGPKPGEPLRKFVLSGLGGNCKTTTALAYALKSRAESAYDGCHMDWEPDPCTG